MISKRLGNIDAEKFCVGAPIDCTFLRKVLQRMLLQSNNIRKQNDCFVIKSAEIQIKCACPRFMILFVRALKFNSIWTSNHPSTHTLFQRFLYDTIERKFEHFCLRLKPRQNICILYVTHITYSTKTNSCSKCERTRPLLRYQS